MSKKIFAAIFAAVLLICTAGCSGEYVMTEDDLALQRSAEGFWLADDSTGYNEYDEYGNFATLTVVEFTNDFKYLLHYCMPGDDAADGYVATGSPIDYTIEKKYFKVEIEGEASYAKVSFSEDGQTMYWGTDEATDIFHKLSDEDIAKYGIPAYDPARWTETESGTDNTESENGIENDTGTSAE